MVDVRYSMCAIQYLCPVEARGWDCSACTVASPILLPAHLPLSSQGHDAASESDALTHLFVSGRRRLLTVLKGAWHDFFFSFYATQSGPNKHNTYMWELKVGITCCHEYCIPPIHVPCFCVCESSNSLLQIPKSKRGSGLSFIFHADEDELGVDPFQCLCLHSLLVGIPATLSTTYTHMAHTQTHTLIQSWGEKFKCWGTEETRWRGRQLDLTVWMMMTTSGYQASPSAHTHPHTC